MAIRWSPLLLTLLVLVSAGCGKSNPLGRQAVTGTISLNGQPLEHGTIEFSPQGEGTASGAVIENGSFSIPADKGLPPETISSASPPPMKRASRSTCPVSPPRSLPN